MEKGEGVPGAEGSDKPNGDDDDQGADAGARVTGAQRSRDDVVTLEADRQYRQHGNVRQHQLHERNQLTYIRPPSYNLNIKSIHSLVHR